jgi:hypothetical protein
MSLLPSQEVFGKCKKSALLSQNSRVEEHFSEPGVTYVRYLRNSTHQNEQRCTHVKGVKLQLPKTFVPYCKVFLNNNKDLLLAFNFSPILFSILNFSAGSKLENKSNYSLFLTESTTLTANKVPVKLLTVTF